MKLSSFDIFDTTLIRKCGTPNNLFWMLSLHLYPHNSCKQVEFYLWRSKINATIARSNINFTIEDVYNSEDVSHFSEYSPEELLKEELKGESEFLMANPDIINIINKKRRTGWGIAFISDMYLHRDFLINILEREGAFQEGDYIFISCENKARKDNGLLYEQIKEELKPTCWEHFGDNVFSDYKIARRYHIKAHIVKTDYTDAENSIINESSKYRQFKELSILASFSRAARIRARDTPEAILAANAVAPLYIPYIKHVLRNAKNNNISRLYFLARDGYILKKIAELDKTDDLELNYLYISRKSLFLPFMYRGTSNDYKLVAFAPTLGDLKVDSLFHDIGLSVEEAREYGFDGKYETLDTEKEKNHFLDFIFSPHVYSIWQVSAKSQYEAFSHYLSKEGFYDNTKIAIVDIGWYGTSRYMLNSIRMRFNSSLSPLKTYYWGATNGYLLESTPIDVYNRSFDAGHPLVFLLERYCSACPHLTTLNYSLNNGNPCLREGDVGQEAFIFRCNLNILSYIFSLIKSVNFSSETLYAWMYITYSNLSLFNFKIDYSPLFKLSKYDEGIIRKLGKRDVVSFIRGKDLGMMSIASIDVSYGYKMRLFLVKCKDLYNVLRTFYYNLKTCLHCKCFFL